MRQLAKFETAANRAWFRNPDAYWYEAVFASDEIPPPGRAGVEPGMTVRGEK